jgi:quercetin dioxygenase-like cupin family protein
MSALFRILIFVPMLLGAQDISSRPLLRTSTTWNGAPIQYPVSAKPEIQTVLVEIAPGTSTPWHKHPVNNIAYILEGTLRLELEDKRTREFRAGESFAEVVDTWHRGTNVGSTPLRILVVYTGEVGVPVTVVRSTH